MSQTDTVCMICGKGYTAASWEDRHSIPFGLRNGGDDCHERCCPRPECIQDRRERRKAKETKHE